MMYTEFININNTLDFKAKMLLTNSNQTYRKIERQNKNFKMLGRQFKIIHSSNKISTFLS